MWSSVWSGIPEGWRCSWWCWVTLGWLYLMVCARHLVRAWSGAGLLDTTVATAAFALGGMGCDGTRCVIQLHVLPLPGWRDSLCYCALTGGDKKYKTKTTKNKNVAAASAAHHLFPQQECAATEIAFCLYRIARVRILHVKCTSRTD